MENLGEFIVNHWILSSLFVVLSWLVFSDTLNRRLGGVRSLGAQEAVRLVNQNKGLFVDVREEEEYAREHIVDAVHIPLGKLAESLDRFKKPDQPLVIVCASGQRARNAAKVLRKHGQQQVFVLAGGLRAWREAKLPLFS